MMKVLNRLAHSKNSIKGAAWILIVTLFLSNVLGAVRNYFLTRNLPVDSLDVYYAAFRLPDLILNLLVLGAISSAFIPVFTSFLHKDEEERAWYVANAVLTVAIVGMCGAVIILFVLMPYLIPQMVPNFGEEKINATVKIARIMLMSPFFFGISYVLGAILNSYQRFVVYSISPLVYNFSIIFGVAVLAPLYSRGDIRQMVVVAVAVGVGAFLHMVIQIPAVRHLGKLRFIWDYKDEAVKRIGKLMIPRTIGLGMNQIVLIVFTAIASASAGAISYFNLANDIQTMPLMVFGISFANAIFPFLAAAAGKEDDGKFSYYLSKTTNVIITLLMPSMVALVFLRRPVIHILLGFSNIESVEITAKTLGILSLSLVASGLVTLFIRAFYARQNSIAPMAIGLISGMVSIILAFTLHGLGAPGLAWAYASGCVVNACLLYLPLRHLYPAINEKVLVITFIKATVASSVMGFGMWWSNRATEGFFDISSRSGMMLQATIGLGVGVGIFLALAWILRIKEVEALWNRAKTS